LARYFLIVVIAFLLYWIVKGTLRRFLAPPKGHRKRTVAARDEKERVTRGGGRTPGIDYSKIKDADYRDL
jgi:hypothetical protein